MHAQLARFMQRPGALEPQNSIYLFSSLQDATQALLVLSATLIYVPGSTFCFPLACSLVRKKLDASTSTLQKQQIDTKVD